MSREKKPKIDPKIKKQLDERYNAAVISDFIFALAHLITLKLIHKMEDNGG